MKTITKEQHTDIAENISWLIRDCLIDEAPNLSVMYIWWPQHGTFQVSAEDDPVVGTGTMFHFETMLPQPSGQPARIVALPQVPCFPPFPDQVTEAVREGVLALRKQWVARRQANGDLPAEGWEHDLAVTMDLL